MLGDKCGSRGEERHLGDQQILNLSREEKQDQVGFLEEMAPERARTRVGWLGTWRENSLRCNLKIKGVVWHFPRTPCNSP